MIPVSVQWHALPGAGDIEVPASSVVAVFAAAGITLSLVRGAAITKALGDVFEHQSVAQLLQALVAQAPLGTIHLLIGVRRGVDGTLISGELLDTDSRQLAIVYSGSDYVVRRGQQGLAETCAHEIGHALNLTHQSVVSTIQSYYYHSAMEQSGYRELGDINQAWNQSRIESDTLARNFGSDPLLFGQPAAGSGCLPFAWIARRQLNDFSSEGTLLPGPGRPFSASDADDRGLRRKINLSAEHDRYAQWGALTLRMKISIPKSQKKTVPALMGPSYGNLNLVITRPDGTSYVHRPRTICCVDKRLAQSAEDLDIAFCTVRGPNGAVFEQSGIYRLRAIASTLGWRSSSLEIEVAPRPDSPLAVASIRRLLSLGRSLSGSARVALQNIVSGDRSIEPQTRAYLALALSRGRRLHAEERQHWLRIASRRQSPEEVRRASLYSRLAHRLSDTRSITRGEIVGLVKRALPKVEDGDSLDRIMGDFEYALQTVRR